MYLHTEQLQNHGKRGVEGALTKSGAEGQAVPRRGQDRYPGGDQRTGGTLKEPREVPVESRGHLVLSRGQKRHRERPEAGRGTGEDGRGRRGAATWTNKNSVYKKMR